MLVVNVDMSGARHSVDIDGNGVQSDVVNVDMGGVVLGIH